MQRIIYSLLTVFLVSCAQPRELARNQVQHSAQAGKANEERLLVPEGKIIDFEALLGPSPEHVVNVDNVKILGRCPKEELEQLVKLVGRIRLDSYALLGVELVWDDRPLAARLVVGQNLVYCVKNANDEWEYRGTARVIAD
jgi:hypothetical protein